MTAIKDPKIILKDKQIKINDFTTENQEIVSYFENLSESDSWEQKLEVALKMGIITIKSITVTGNINYVEKAFENLDEKMKRGLDLAFGDNGQFSGLLKDHFGEDGKIIKELFDPNREGTPLHSLRLELEKELSEIKDKIGIKAAVKEVTDKSTRKGMVFEDYCEQILDHIAQIHSDKIKRTSNDYGKLSKNKKGDFVITLGDIGKKIVFEMKDRESISQPTLEKELDEAMENREAEYGIFVAKTKDSLPKSVGWFNEYDGNHLICAMGNSEDDSQIDGEILHIAYKWARARLRIESTKEKKLDISFIIEKTGMIQNKIKDLRSIKSECKNIGNSAQKIRDTITSTESEIKNDLNEIIESLNSEE